MQNHTASTALRGFGRSLGRVVSYRALALDDAALTGILEEDCIFPSGQLQVSADTLAGIVDTHGVQAVCVCRLFIAYLRCILGHDPSVSLHDDWQTTSIIASGYVQAQGAAPLRVVDDTGNSFAAAKRCKTAGNLAGKRQRLAASRVLARCFETNVDN